MTKLENTSVLRLRDNNDFVDILVDARPINKETIDALLAAINEIKSHVRNKLLVELAYFVLADAGGVINGVPMRIIPQSVTNADIIPDDDGQLCLFDSDRDTITTRDTFGEEQTYRLVKKMPTDIWFVWNIGDNMGSDRHIPIARPGSNGPYSVDADHLCAIELPPEQVQLLRWAAAAGVTNLSEAEHEARLKRRSKLSRRMLSDDDLTKVLSIMKMLYNRT